MDFTPGNLRSIVRCSEEMVDSSHFKNAATTKAEPAACKPNRTDGAGTQEMERLP